jgi:pimeloyl-ACP methyl ester carboxylesterase
MGPKFIALLDSAYSEITRRDLGYLERFQTGLPSPSAAAVRYLSHPLAAGLGRAAIEEALAAGFAHLARMLPRLRESDVAADPLASFLCTSIVDALWAERELISLKANAADLNISLPTLLSGAYVEQQLDGGTRYFVRDGGNHPLLVITAMGIPVRIWQRLLADGTHPFRIVLAENQTGGLFGGGYRRYADIAAEADALISVLDAETIDQIDVVAWCNGARVALHLARRYPERVSSLVLVAPQLCGNLLGVPANPSPFERDLGIVLQEVTNRPQVAPFLSKAILDTMKRSPDWDQLAADSIGRIAALFGLPASDQRDILVAPFCTAETMIMLARRVVSDEAYPMHEALAAVSAPTMIMLGANDHIVNNAFIISAVKRWAPAAVVAILEGAGHYIQDLQYNYFRFALDEFLQKARPPVATARLSLTSFVSRHWPC